MDLCVTDFHQLGLCTCAFLNLPSEEQRRIGVNRPDSGPHHHAVPVREWTLGNVRKNQLADLVREAAQGVSAQTALTNQKTYQAPQYRMNGSIRGELTISMEPASHPTWRAT